MGFPSFNWRHRIRLALVCAHAPLHSHVLYCVLLSVGRRGTGPPATPERSTGNSGGGIPATPSSPVASQGLREGMVHHAVGLLCRALELLAVRLFGLHIGPSLKSQSNPVHLSSAWSTQRVQPEMCHGTLQWPSQPMRQRHQLPRRRGVCV